MAQVTVYSSKADKFSFLHLSSYLPIKRLEPLFTCLILPQVWVKEKFFLGIYANIPVLLLFFCGTYNPLC